MDEKILFKYNTSEDAAFQKVKKAMLVLGIIIFALGFWLFITQLGSSTIIGGLVIVYAVLLEISMILQGKMGITVTSTRVYGRTMFSEVSLPMDSVTMTSKSGSRNLRVESPSENFVFGFRNTKMRDEAYDVINRLISERTNNKGNVTVVNSTSNADELAKYKQLLDTGIITREEFDAKKKQLLGL